MIEEIEPGRARSPVDHFLVPAHGASAVTNEHVVKAAIHPSIGIARVGDSPDAFFYAPDVVEPQPEKPGFYRDASGALKRQAARFRVYGLDAKGRALLELTADNAVIEWSVHLANRKASWYQFQIALDIPEAASTAPTLLRNPSVPDRTSLIIDPGARSITGKSKQGEPKLILDTGSFMGTPIYLGELRTDDKGRLVVLGGHGRSGSDNGTRAVTFANNDSWYDDISDGPVRAAVRFAGRELPVDPAWVVVAPPNYAPLQKSVRTMWDLMRDLAIREGTLSLPARPSFTHDIQPIFQRMSRLQWVNAGFAAAFGWGGLYDFAAADWLRRLSQRTVADQPLRNRIAEQFRVFGRDAWSPVPWPWLYGDAFGVPTPSTPRAFSTLTDTQLTMLQKWAGGDFDPDYDPARQPPCQLTDVDVAEQPAMLDRASLEYCLADAFHPGCEMTWIMRLPSLYMAPFRIAHATPEWVEPPDYGGQLSVDMIFENHPFLGQVAGGITRWLAIPWQTDTASCKSGFTPEYDPFLPTFWPARVPNHVLSEADYRIVVDDERPLGERIAAFARRCDWRRPLKMRGARYPEIINSMVLDISQMGIVEAREGLRHDPNFPPVMEVENLPSRTQKALTALGPIPDDHPTERRSAKTRRFPHGLKT